MKSFCFFIAICVTVPLAWRQGNGATEGDVVICEVMPDPASVSDAYGEWFELYNNCESAVNLKGWVIKDLGSNLHIVTADVIVAVGGVAVLARHSDPAQNGGLTPQYVYASFTLSNTTDAIIIEDDLGNEIDRVEYTVEWPFSPGHAMALRVTSPDQDNNNASAWTEEIGMTYGNGDYGTPGYLGGDQSLPVTLTSFTASVTEEGVVLEWITESEVDNRGFYLRRAEDAWNSEYLAISGLIEGEGSTSASHHYSYLDRNIGIGCRYWYTLQQVDFNGGTQTFGPLEVFVGERQDGRTEGTLPGETALSANYPNPFNPVTTIPFSVAEEQRLEVAVFNAGGGKIRTLLDGTLPRGRFTVVWDGLDAAGRMTASGVYICRMSGMHCAQRAIKLLKIN